MDASFFRGLRVLFIGHGDCISWFNFCQARDIPNLSFPPQVEVRLLAQPSATLRFLTSKARSIFQFRPHVIVIHLGMFDLFRQGCDPLVLADRFWHISSLLVSCMKGSYPTKVIIIGQLRNPEHLAPDRLYCERVDAFHSRILRLINGSSSISFLCIGDIMSILRCGVGVVGVGLRNWTPQELPAYTALMIIKRRIAAILNSPRKYVYHFLC